MIDPQYYQYLDYALILQDYFVDKDSGLPLSGGQVTFYVDNGGLTLKTVYYQVGTSPPYTYTALPNPVTLSSVGTIMDGSGNDVIPYFFPFDESALTDSPPQLIPQGYRVECVSSTAIDQWTRYNFDGPVSGGAPVPTTVNSLKNLLINNGFWRSNKLTTTYSLNGVSNTVIAPGMHDGFNISTTQDAEDLTHFLGNSDIRFIKTGTLTATDTISVISLQGINLPGGTNIAQGLKYSCTVAATGETHKSIQFPISLNLNNLSNNVYSIGFYARAVSGANTITPIIAQFLGTGSTNSQVTSPYYTKYNPLSAITLTDQWEFYPVTSQIFPSGDLPLKGEAGDDASFLLFDVPLNAVCDIEFASPGFFLGTQVPTDYFQTYDEVNSIISSPRTGDIRQSLNIWSQNINPTVGWVYMNDGVIGNSNSVTSGYPSIQTWQLYRLIWNSFHGNQAAAPMYGLGVIPAPVPPVWPPTNQTTYAVSPYADFIVGNSITLPAVQGRVISSVGQALNLTGPAKLLGSFDGNKTHTLSQADLPNVTPTFTGGVEQAFAAWTSGGNNQTVAAGDNFVNHGTFTPSGTISSINPGVQTAFDITQPTNYFNFYMKL